MASQGDINNQRDLNSEVDVTLSLEEELLQVLQRRRGVESDSLSDNQDINNVLQKQLKELKDQVSEKTLIKKLSGDVVSIAEKTYAITSDQLGLAKTNKDLTDQQASLDEKIILLEQQKLKLQKDAANLTGEEKQKNLDIANSIGEQIFEAQKLKTQIGDVLTQSEEISKNFGVKGMQGLSATIKEIPALKQFSGPFEEAAESSRKMATDIADAATSGGKGLTKEKIKQLGLEKELGNLSGSAAAQKLKGMSAAKKSQLALNAGFKALGPILKKALGPLALIKELIDAMAFIDKKSGEIAKNFGISAKEGQELVEASNDAAGNIRDILVSTKDVLAAQMALNKEFGVAVQFSGEFAAEFASIQERTNLSGEAMGLFAANALITGQNIKDQLTDITATTMELNNQSGISFSFKEIQEGLAKTSKAALLTAGRNTKELANQVYQAKLLGVEQSKVEGISENLLDFEGSIAKELEAELLIGKDLNLERARAAALEGDLATVAKEIKEQIGDAAEFGEMNVIQQKALAESVGMTREELAASLAEQEQLEAIRKAGFKDLSEAQEKYNKLRAEGYSAEEAALAIGDKALANQLESASAADKMAAINEKISDLFIQIGSALMPVLDILMVIVEEALTPIFQILNPILDLFTDLLKGILDPIATILTNMIKPVMDSLQEPIKILQDSLSEVKEAFSGIFGEAEGTFDLFEMLGGILSIAIVPAFAVIEGALLFIANIAKGITDIFEGIGQILSGDITEGFKTMGKGLAKILIAPFQFIADVVIAIINGIIDAVNYIPGVDISPVEFDIAKTIGLVEDEVDENTETESSENSSTPTIGLAEGGIVTKPTTALIGEGGEPEAVTPLSKLGSFMAKYHPLGIAARSASEGIDSFMDSSLGKKFTGMTGIGGQSNEEKMVALLERLVISVEKGGIVELDGNKVGTALGLSSYKTQ